MGGPNATGCFRIHDISVAGREPPAPTTRQTSVDFVAVCILSDADVDGSPHPGATADAVQHVPQTS
jgi:hypothetical protein